MTALRRCGVPSPYGASCSATPTSTSKPDGASAVWLPGRTVSVGSIVSFSHPVGAGSLSDAVRNWPGRFHVSTFRDAVRAPGVQSVGLVRNGCGGTPAASARD